MSDVGEVLLGELTVTTRLTLGSEHLRLLVTSDRLVVDHIGKRGTGAVAGVNFLGRLSGAFEDLFKSGKESASRRGIAKKSPDQVLKAHRDNFAVNYREVVNVTVEQTASLNSIIVLTRDDKFEFLTRTKFDNVLELLGKTLGDKLTAKRLSPRKPHARPH